jgi:predicted dithiol-disulfide oxidoreductase (DUF899 family)
MAWTVPWYSSHGRDFNYDFHATLDESVTTVEYTYARGTDLLNGTFNYLDLTALGRQEPWGRTTGTQLAAAGKRLVVAAR